MTNEYSPRYRLRLRPGREKSVLRGHPWIFSGAVEEVEALADARPGDVGDVIDAKGQFLARGTVHPESQIVCRILTREPRSIDTEFFAERIDWALALRDGLFRGRETNAYRLINAEGDELPGLIVDRYHHILVCQTLTPGMRLLEPLWQDILTDRLGPQAIVERGEAAAREPVGESPGFLRRGLLPDGPVRIQENGHGFLADVRGGQKTGFYLDQRVNRDHCGRIAHERDVLNLFAYSGGFSVYAGHGGATRVVEVETSAAARSLASENWALNGLDPARLEQVDEDAFEYLRRGTDEFDLLVLDPPPLARNRGALEGALRAYKDLHLHAFRRSRPGAWIFTFTCSQHVSAELFQKIVFGAAQDVGARVQWVERLGAGFDHPVHLDHPEGEYLKGLLLRVLVPGRPMRRRVELGAADGESRTKAKSGETPATEIPATETPAETQVAEAPAAETPATETPASKTPAAETQVAEAPAAETPAAETLASKTPAAETLAAVASSVTPPASTILANSLKQPSYTPAGTIRKEETES